MCGSNESVPGDQIMQPDNPNIAKKRESTVPGLRFPDMSESTTVLVGSVDYLKKPITAFVRLAHACFLGNLMEVDVPVRFIFVLLGPADDKNRYKEIGRSVAAMMSDKPFLESAYNFKV